MVRVMTAREPVVRAHFIILSTLSIGVFFATLLLVEGEDDYFDLLLGNSVTDELDSELLIGPVLTSEAVEDSSGIAVVLLQTLCQHAQEKLLWQVLELLRV